LYKYLISFSFTNKDGSSGFGDTKLTHRNPIDIDDIELLREELIKECSDTREIIFLNIIPLPIK